MHGALITFDYILFDMNMSVCVCVHTPDGPLSITDMRMAGAVLYTTLSFHSTLLFSLNILSVVLLPWRRLLLAPLVLLFWWWVGGNIETLSLSKGIGNFQMASPLSLTHTVAEAVVVVPISKRVPSHLVLTLSISFHSTPLYSTL